MKEQLKGLWSLIASSKILQTAILVVAIAFSLSIIFGKTSCSNPITGTKMETESVLPHMIEEVIESHDSRDTD